MDDIPATLNLRALGARPENPTGTITAYDAHIYYDGASKQEAGHLRRAISRKFDFKIGRWRDKRNNLHGASFYLVLFAAESFQDFVPWLALNRQGLSILVHPHTGDGFADHTDHAIWLGAPVAINAEILKPKS